VFLIPCYIVSYNINIKMTTFTPICFVGSMFYLLLVFIYNTISISHYFLWILTVAQRVPLVEQELLILPFLVGFIVSFMYSVFLRSCFVLFISAIVLSVLLRFTTSDYHHLQTFPINCSTYSSEKKQSSFWCNVFWKSWGRPGRDRMVVAFTTTYAISAYHQWCEL
jgi:hypothetical protein